MPDQVNVRRGMLTDEDRALVVLANRERLPLIVATMHACIFKLAGGPPQEMPCEEDVLILGTPTDWNSLRIRLAHPTYTKAANVPWLSAVRVYRPDTAPPEDEMRRTIAAYGLGRAQREHPA